LCGALHSLSEIGGVILVIDIQTSHADIASASSYSQSADKGVHLIDVISNYETGNRLWEL
jgi:hypothetical protein